jgi:hypothetical protein
VTRYTGGPQGGASRDRGGLERLVHGEVSGGR